ncbi:hypothetical protein A7985_06255 [Pseudoalteromonas luteoviolacea]|uniref:M23ase beta-sheet core domain-containing protein n=1 Tax=Pseudoalteromonas luteoviolacea TaxID=43657 RepID=A0A1C0TW50_9GAMM|nr:M23 family metallopeptidase [Pseudoalteromonas luteoviolacea]OCQ23540.1 hypothetical protein A7985_06255 [Pseudoalteromonas luteoviolacea]
MQLPQLLCSLFIAHSKVIIFKERKLTYFKRILFGLFIVILLGTLVPEKIQIPVTGASTHDWNQETFWYESWGSSRVHKGIDIFGKVGTTVISAGDGFVIFKGDVEKGGNAVAVLGPKWRIHYYAHMRRHYF